MLKRRDVGVSHNPESNMKLASGTAPVVEYLAGRRRASGSAPTAPPATTTSTCSRRCARRRSCTSTQRNDPRALPAQAVAGHGDARRRRARSGSPSASGSLEAGQARRPDHRVDTRGARQTPIYDPVSHLVYVTRGDDVTTTIVNGKVLMRDRKVLTLDAKRR